MISMNVVSVRLPSKYDAIHNLDGEISIPGTSDNTLHWFALSTLQPYVTPFLDYIALGSDITSPSIQNPTGAMPPSPPGYWEMPQWGGDINGNASAIFLKGPELDFSNFTDPEIVFAWDLRGLVELYDAGTATDYTDDIVTFNLANPFSISISVQEKSSPTSASASDSTPPAEVLLPTISGPGTIADPDGILSEQTVLQWVNPIDEDFDKAVIVRKADPAPTSRADGELAYGGFEPNFCDITGTVGVHYYYRVFAVDFSGNYSEGMVLDQVQH